MRKVVRDQARILRLVGWRLGSRKLRHAFCRLKRLSKYPANRKIVQARAAQHVNFASARCAPAGVRGIGEKDYNGATAGCRDMCGPGVVPDSKSGCVGEVDQAGELGAANEVDRSRTRRANLGREHLLACAADNGRENTGRLE